MAIATQRPKFRTDLVAQPLDVEGQRFVDVTDPDSEQTFRFYEVEYAIAAAMDGQRDVSGLMRWASEELGLESSPDELATVVNTLADLGYLEKNGVSGASLELGSAGPTDPGEQPPAPAGGDVELGFAGGQPSSRAPAVASGSSEFELGSPGGPGKVSGAEESFAGLMDESQLGPAGGENRADTAAMAGSEEPEEDVSLPPPPAPPATADPKPMLTRSPGGAADDQDDGDTQLPAPEPPAYDDDDVSVNLSDHLSLDANDVKEAVRASKVMQAVPQPDLAAHIEDEIEDAPALHQEADEPPPIELSSDRDDEVGPAPAAAAVEPVASPAPPESTSSLGTLFLVLLLVIVAGGAAYYFLVLERQQGDAASGSPTEAAATDATKTAPPPPPPVTAALVEGAPATTDVGAIADGKIEWIISSGEQVAEGDVVARLDGARRVEAVRRRFEKRQEHYQRKLDRAQADGDTGKIAAFKAKVEEKKALVSAEDDKLGRLVMRAAAAGTVEPVVRSGVSVGRGDPVLRIVGENGLSATFDRGGSELKVGDSCALVLADGTRPAGCEVLEVTGDRVTVRLPSASEAAVGDQVTLEL